MKAHATTLKMATFLEKSGLRTLAATEFFLIYSSTGNTKMLLRAAVNSRCAMKPPFRRSSAETHKYFRLLDNLLVLEDTNASHAMRGRGLRDWAMVYAADGDFSRALFMLNRAAHLHRSYTYGSNKLSEMGATQSHVGQVLLASGDKKAALTTFREANRLLHQGHNKDYMLFNLIKLIRHPDIPADERNLLARKAFDLAKKLRYPRHLLVAWWYLRKTPK